MAVWSASPSGRLWQAIRPLGDYLMRYEALACDYDGTLARDGHVDRATFAALERLRATDRKLLLVTGRELGELGEVCPRLDLFDRVVAENGALLFTPLTNDHRVLSNPVPLQFADTLRERGVGALSVGYVIVATWQPFEAVVAETIRDLGLDLRIIRNKDAVMVLPNAVNKATGLEAALAALSIPAERVVGVGDAENDLPFLASCGFAAAVANALPSVQEQADLVTRHTHGPGVVELIEQMLNGGLRKRDAARKARRSS